MATEEKEVLKASLLLCPRQLPGSFYKFLLYLYLFVLNKRSGKVDGMRWLPPSSLFVLSVLLLDVLILLQDRFLLLGVGILIGVLGSLIEKLL